MLTHPSRRLFVQAALAAPLILISGCSAISNNAFEDAASGRALLLNRLEKKYAFPFVAVSDLKEESYKGLRSVSGKVAPTDNPAAQADAWVDSQGNWGVTIPLECSKTRQNAISGPFVLRTPTL